MPQLNNERLNKEKKNDKEKSRNKCENDPETALKCPAWQGRNLSSICVAEEQRTGHCMSPVARRVTAGDVTCLQGRAESSLLHAGHHPLLFQLRQAGKNPALPQKSLLLRSAESRKGKIDGRRRRQNTGLPLLLLGWVTAATECRIKSPRAHPKSGTCETAWHHSGTHIQL